MKYGYFDSKNREYCITNPATPAPWANYLGSPAYGAIISNNAGGYSFVKSGAAGRIIRYHFNQDDTPGRYIYVRDDVTHDFWSASWQPVGKPLDVYKNICRHGTGYTKFTSQYNKIESNVTYYVPKDKEYEIWYTKIKNTDTRKRSLSVFGYAEFTTDTHYDQDQVNLQYTQFITRSYFDKNQIRVIQNENLPDTEKVERSAFDGNERLVRFLALVGNPIKSYEGDKKTFIGNYHSYSNPVALENGSCSNRLNYNGNPCGALQTKFELASGEEKTLIFVMGQHQDEKISEIIAMYENSLKKTDKSEENICDKEILELKNFWHSKLQNFRVQTPNANFNEMVNTWNAYQCFTTFVWSRAASFSYCGARNGYGYRDTVQDIQGVIHLDPVAAKKRLEFMLSAQVDNGAGLPLVKFTHNAGHEDTPDDESYVQETGHPSYRADDALWLFPTVYKYIVETGDIAFLDKEILFANKDRASVYDHLKRAIDFSLNHLAAHDMPAGLHADWNDCLRLGENGESTFVAMQLYYAMKLMLEWAKMRNDTEYSSFISKKATELYAVLQKCWDEDRFIRGYRETGEAVGGKKDIEANLWLNPQSWAVISGCATKEEAEKALESVHRELNTQYGLKLLSPSYKKHAFEGALMILFNGSTKENGGIFCQSQGWIILAEALMGHGNRAFQYFKESCPASMNDKAEIRVCEPYVHSQFIESSDSPYEGRAHVHWLSGTASTVMVSCVEGVLGMRPRVDGLEINPSIPSEWKNFTIDKVFRSKKLHIEVSNPNGKESGVLLATLNGEELPIVPQSTGVENSMSIGAFISANDLQEKNEISIIM
ncbi:MAG: N,N'-diacetylchitobiose phosphorylase [Treponema sp. CETP13]|nr:MAG: N,N'-diacetylchitobiose phosphorylase [Treponema sp. CETP13]